MSRRSSSPPLFLPPFGPIDADEGAMWLGWLIRLRWVAIIGQAVTLSFAVGMLHNPVWVVPSLAGLMVMLGGVNYVSIRILQRKEHIGQLSLLLQLLVDVAVLTAFFFASGGHNNPFIVLYMLHVSMGAVMLRAGLASLLMSAVLIANGLLHLNHLPLHLDRHWLPGELVYSMGQTTGFTVTVVSLGLFLLGMSQSLRQQKRTLLEARERSARTDRLRSVGTLAAGAAHELNTPLSTIKMRIKRVQRRHEDDPTVNDLTVMQAQLDRCVDIVQRLLFGAGDPSASDIQRVSLATMVAQTVQLWSKGSPVDVELGQLDDVMVELPQVAFSQAFINLLENAREAQLETGNTTPLKVEVRRGPRPDKPCGMVTVRDAGPGLPSDADRIGEPFFTTKPTGTGLGVFVARQVAEGVGGGLAYDRDKNHTLTKWWFPELGGSRDQAR